METGWSVSIRGKILGVADLKRIQEILATHPQTSRRRLSIKVCETFNWRQPNGKPQDVAAREILRRLESRGLIVLPAGRHNGHNDRRKTVPDGNELPLEYSSLAIEGQLTRADCVSLENIQTASDSRLWRNLVERYHYLGYKPMVGRSLKYFIHRNGQAVGAISWGSACWKLSSRDSFIGWDETTRIKNLQNIAGNHRFLILPGVLVKNLASHVLSLAARVVPQDWLQVYGIKLCLLESFVDPSRFKGTCYKAANWIYLGKSQGSSKSGNRYFFHGQAKDVYVLPVTRDFREKLCQRQ